MKTIIFSGSPRTDGHTAQMIKLFVDHLGGDVECINAYKDPVSPCIDCRYCWHKKGCSIQDGMQAIYKKIDRADTIVFAFPIYFNGVPGPLKMMIDRLQVYWAGTLRKDKPKELTKNGAMLLVGGAPNFKDQFTGAQHTINRVFKDLNAKNLGAAKLSNSDKDSLKTRKEVKEQIMELAKQIKGIKQNKTDHLTRL